jgi:hypothetical protein
MMVPPLLLAVRYLQQPQAQGSFSLTARLAPSPYFVDNAEDTQDVGITDHPAFVWIIVTFTLCIVLLVCICCCCLGGYVMTAKRRRRRCHQSLPQTHKKRQQQQFPQLGFAQIYPVSNQEKDHYYCPTTISLGDGTTSQRPTTNNNNMHKSNENASTKHYYDDGNDRRILYID